MKGRFLLRGFSVFLRSVSPAKLVAWGYLWYMVVGGFLLVLPFAHALRPVSAVDALFTSVSAVSTTGLTTVSTGNDYSLFGQIVILLLIQVGGLGFMTFSSFVVLSRGFLLSKPRADLANVVFTLPTAFPMDAFVRGVVAFTLLIETCGVAALFPILAHHNVRLPLWSAIFHSVSAFCTAGFSLHDTSFEAFAGDPWLNLVIAILSYAGGIGFIVFVDCWRRITGQSRSITLTSKVILQATFWLSVLGTLVFFLSEASIRLMSPPQRLLAAFFQTMSALTTVGFNTIPISGVSQATVTLLVILMIIGASPAGTGGGLKTTTFSVIYATVKAVLRGEDDVLCGGEVIPIRRIRTAYASLGLYISCLMAGTFLLSLTEPADLRNLAFEVTSALGTVGLSGGITQALSPIGKCVIILVMFLGRLGPLTFGLIFFVRSLPQDRDLAV